MMHNSLRTICFPFNLLIVCFSVHTRKGDITKSLENHLQAWKMIGVITKGKPEQHFDSPLHIMNIGACYYSKGNEWMDKNKTKEAEK